MRYRKISKILIIIFFANLLVAAVKICFGQVLHINSLKADGFHALTDTLSNIIALIGIKFASKAPDKDHPYGYQKFETIAGLAIGFFLLGITYNIASSAIKTFLHPESIEVSIYSLLSLGITIIINIIVATIEYKKGKALNSDCLISDSMHTRSDILLSSSVLITMILIKYNLPIIIDPILSIIIAIFIFKSCIEIMKMTIGILVDKSVVDPDEVIKIIMESDPEVVNVHKIRSRGRLDHIYIDSHIIVNPEMTVKDAHILSHKLEDALKKSLGKEVELFAHIEPNERL